MTEKSDLDLAFAALADPTRRSILETLARGPSTVGDLAEPFQMSGPAVSRHLKILERAQLITRTTNAQWRTITLRTAPFTGVTDWIETQRLRWDQRFTALDAHLEKMKETTRTVEGTPVSTHDTTPEFTINRTFNAPRKLVWRAWTTEEHLAAWFAPFGVTAESVSVDLRVGGRYRYTMVNQDTSEKYPTGGEYLAIIPVEHLSFTWGEPEAPVEDAAVISLTLNSSTGGDDTTEMTFHVRGVDGRPGDNNVYDGWDEALTNLARHLSGEPG